MTLAGGTFRAVKFSTGYLPPREHLTAYRDMLGRSVGNFEVAAIEDAFDFSATSYALPGLGIAHIASSALRIARTPETAADDTRDLVLAVVHDGTAWREQRGREARSCLGATIRW